MENNQRSGFDSNETDLVETEFYSQRNLPMRIQGEENGAAKKIKN